MLEVDRLERRVGNASFKGGGVEVFLRANEEPSDLALARMVGLVRLEFRDNVLGTLESGMSEGEVSRRESISSSSSSPGLETVLCSGLLGTSADSLRSLSFATLSMLGLPDVTLTGADRTRRDVSVVLLFEPLDAPSCM